MPLTKDFIFMELSDAKIYEMTADSGASPTYATGIDIPGLVKIGVSPKADTKKLTGDSTTLDIYSKMTEVEVEIEAAKANLDVLKVIMGGTVTASGVTPNQVNTFELTADTAKPKFFKIEGQWTYAGEGLGDAHIILDKVKATDLPSFDVEDASGNFGKLKFKGIAVQTASNQKWLRIILNETKAAIV